MSFLLKIDNVSFSYDNSKNNCNLADINQNIEKGEVILLCGESGCGKTTLTRMINGIIPNFFDGTRQGNVYLDGNLISEMPIYEISRYVGSVFQNPKTQFFNVDTTSEIVFGCENLAMNTDEIKNRLNYVVNDFKLQHLLDKNIFKLSGGEKQKIAGASVSAVFPDIFVLDEPSSNLDSESSWDLEDIIKKWKESGKTVIVVEHKLFFLSNVVDRVIFMEKGQITNEWSMDQFRYIDHRDYGLRQLNLKKLVVNHSEYYSNNHEMIELKNFNFKYGKNQVLNIDEVKIPKNEIIAVIGKNGAGKSTFANCLCGLKKSCKGEIIWGDNHLKRKDLLKKTYMVMQDVNHQLFTESVLDEVLLSMDDENICVAEEILTNLNLIHLKEMHPMALSGGEKQRVAIASAIASGKEFLIFDEPTSGLDLKNMMKVSENLVYLQKLGVTSFIITHDFELIMEVCSHILHMEDGKIIDNYKINEEKTDKRLIQILNELTIKIVETPQDSEGNVNEENNDETGSKEHRNKKVVYTNTLTKEEIEKLQLGETKEINYENLKSNTKYTIEITGNVELGNTKEEVPVTYTYKEFTTLKIPAKVEIKNQFVTGNLIDLDVRVEDENNAVLNNKVRMELRDEKSNLIDLQEIETNKDWLRKTYEKLEENKTYKLSFYADQYNEGSTDKTYKVNYLIKEIEKQKPNIIVVTGDFIDSNKTNVEVAMNFIKKINAVAPIYYVSGNHEASVKSYTKIKEQLAENKVVILENKKEELKINESSINLIGIDDPRMAHESFISDSEIVKVELDNTKYNGDKYNILLSHRPELFDTYVEKKIDLILTGHAHGGQIRIPFIGGIIAPNQGFFPKYTSGVIEKNKTTMVVSRGIGNSIIPLRINNRPELVVITLCNK